MNIAHLISSGGLFGAERVILNLAQNQNNDLDKAWVCAINNLSNPHLEIIDEAKNKKLPTFVVDSHSRFDLKTADLFADFLKENSIDIIHSHNYKANIIGLIAAKKSGISIVATNHLWTMADRKLRFYESIDAYLFRWFFKKIIAVSVEIKKDMLRKGVQVNKIIVIPNGIDTSFVPCDMKLARQHFGISETAVVLGIIARLSVEKGHQYFFEALKYIVLNNEQKDIKVLIIGDGPLLSNLKLKVKNEKLEDKVIFVGYQKDVENVYAAIDILVQPSLREGVPMVLLEAMLRGKAIIATRVGDVPKLIEDGKTGFLIDPGNVKQLEITVKKLISDPSLREKIGKEASIFVKNNYS